MDKDIFFMMEAIKEAKVAFDEDEVPIGAVLVYKNKIIAKGHNQVIKLNDATAHAEMLCITAGSIYFNDWRLNNTTLYSTLEPCVMCAGAIIAARIETLVWSAKDQRVGANGSFVDIFKKKHPIHNMLIRKNILEEISSDLMKKFFRKQRTKKILNTI